MKTSRLLELAGLEAQSKKARIAEENLQDMIKSGMYDRLVYTHPKHEEEGPKAEELNGVEYDEKTGEVHLMNTSDLAEMHKALVKRGWKRNGKRLPPNKTPGVPTGTVPYEKK